ncbi:hypothetical protein LTR91_021869 [Friedmanniomyces endolithicus]|uniref:Major facilitator superfamily (MFS) profile domain-containing protein n=1 Tax=Friedmanniomyces endolithicus TaxID=329885 RepID=A0AAN6JZT0_9PEZI|nr:hypothetical protein LTR94_018591 [Friedmanniomyces endolithicus]KAK0776881.1 hypothetical protein LTR38_015359 [Friedmanniomyces endolithicus]KAK0890222.1 hypothetical protein LTR02_014861 [Friedmanniomyces endolithicus]KAK0895741.1 hypothetical protein LTR57_022890 [Friedmanniomyces endolithicus]KAK0957435.1 hypothetical protein LTR91_021869 [Friedmanniomyces endolithicus]
MASEAEIETASPDKPIIQMEPLTLDEVKKPRTRLRTIAILTALYLAVFISALDQTIMATSIPTISAQLHSASGYVWIGSAYLLANAAAGPVWAKCSDIWGRKPALLGAVVLFAGASIMGALSVSMNMLIAARALQGTAGGGLLQLVFITISDLFSMRERVLYLGLTEVLWAIAGGIGPLIGGAFTQLVTWRWCFWVNLPICVGTTFILLFCFLDVHNPRTGFSEGLAAIDWFGTLSILGVIIMLLLGLDFGGAVFPWSSPTVICLIVFGIVMIGVFLFSEKKLAKYPLIPLAMFKDPSNLAIFVIGATQGICYIPAEYYLPLYFQSAKQASPLRSGVLILPITVCEGAFGILSGVIMHQTGRYREVMWAGVFLILIGTGLYISIGADSSIPKLVGFMIIGGSGCGLLFEAPVIAIQNTVSQADTATATAAFGMIRNIATSISIVLGGVIFQNSMAGQAERLQRASLDPTVVEALTNGQAAANVEIIGTIENVVQRDVVRYAFASSFRNMWIMYTCIAAVGLIAGAFIKQGHLSKEHTETRTGIQEMTERVKK